MQKKLFFTYVVLILFLTCFIGFFSIRICRDYYTNDFKNHMVKEMQVVTSVLEESWNKPTFVLDEFVNDFAEVLEVRFTVIDTDGRVLSDSNAEEASMENHLDREEIQQALTGRTAVVSRFSITTRTDYIYVAQMVTLENKNLILRFATPMLTLGIIRDQMVIYISFSIVICSVIAFFCAYFFSKRISEPLDELTKAVDEIAKGNYSKKIFVDSTEQIGSLSKAFNQMSYQLNTTMHQLEDENYKMEAIVNSMINGVVAVDMDNKVLMMNRMCHTLFDLKESQTIGQSFYDVFRNDMIYQVLEKSLKSKQALWEEMVLHSPYSGDKILRIYVNPITGGKKSTEHMGTLLVFQDITQIRKLEQLRSNFVSNVTHELKTPLTSIMGFTDTLKAGAIDDHEAAIRFLDIIEIETKRLYRLIQDILALSEIETRKEDIYMSYESLPALLTEVEKLLKPQAEKKGLTLHVSIASDFPLFYCNHDRILQLLINLIENAIKYTEKGSVSVCCKNQDSYLELSIKDTGIGIPEGSLERIFERFYRVDKGRSRQAGGTGLGLSIVKHIIILYEGKIHVESKENEGTTFMIQLPYKNPQKEV